MKMSEKQISTSVISGTLVYGGSSAILVTGRFFLVTIYAHYLNPEQYGLFSTAIAISSFFSMLFTLGLDGTVSREYFDDASKDNHKFNQFLATIISFLLIFDGIMILIFSIIGIFIENSINLQFGIEYFPYIQLALCIAYVVPIISIALVVLQVRRKAFHYGATQIGRLIVFASITLTLLIVFEAGPASILWGELISTIIAALFIWLYNIRGEKISTSVINPISHLNIQIIVKSLKYGLPIVPQSLFNWLNAMFDRFILLSFLGLEAVGIYSFGSTMGLVMNMIISSLNLAYVPHFLGEAAKRSQFQAHGNIAQCYVIVVGLPCLIIASFSNELVQIIAPFKYYGAAPILSIVTLAFYWQGLYLMTVLPIYHMKRTGFLPVVVGSAVLLNVLMSYILIPMFGILGSAIGKLVAYAAMAVLAWGISQKIYPIRYSFYNFWFVAIAFSCASLLLQYQTLAYKIGAVAIAGIVSLARLHYLWVHNIDMLRRHP